MVILGTDHSSTHAQLLRLSFGGIFGRMQLIRFHRGASAHPSQARHVNFEGIFL